MKIKDRNKQILRMRKNRYKLREIGDKFGLTKQRVGQILRKLSTDRALQK
jgi:DNA-directed RNA polymerase sigma subunit (sigma70/sigma32)